VTGRGGQLVDILPGALLGSEVDAENRRHIGRSSCPGGGSSGVRTSGGQAEVQDYALSDDFAEAKPSPCALCLPLRGERAEAMVMPSGTMADKGAERDTSNAASEGEDVFAGLLDQSSDRDCYEDRSRVWWRSMAKLSRSIRRRRQLVRHRSMRERWQMVRQPGLLQVRATIRPGMGAALRPTLSLKGAQC
jgi:hypothetical protein